MKALVACLLVQLQRAVSSQSITPPLAVGGDAGVIGGTLVSLLAAIAMISICVIVCLMYWKKSKLAAQRCEITEPATATAIDCRASTSKQWVLPGITSPSQIKDELHATPSPRKAGKGTFVRSRDRTIVEQHYEFDTSARSPVLEEGGDEEQHYEFDETSRLVSGYQPMDNSTVYASSSVNGGSGVYEATYAVLAPIIPEDGNSGEVIYAEPEKDEFSLYAQFKRLGITQISRSALSVTEFLGSGQFGTVQRGVWQSPAGGQVEVAVKTLTAEAVKVKFLQEAAIMGQFQHRNVVKLHGVVTVGDPLMIILEMLPKGDLRHYLTALKDSENVEQGLSHTLLSYCRQVASGMSYLAGKAFVHRDLAARNILVSEDGTIKVADFGMARDLMEENYYVSHGGQIPVKWTAPEALHYKKYSTASDVWSFGVVMYEIWSLGHKPFEGYTNIEALRVIDSGVRLPPPPGCPRAIYALMIKCWHPDSTERPTFKQVVCELSLDDADILRWTVKDKTVHPQVSLLAEDIDIATELYKDLQNTYCT